MFVFTVVCSHMNHMSGEFLNYFVTIHGKTTVVINPITIIVIGWLEKKNLTASGRAAHQFLLSRIYFRNLLGGVFSIADHILTFL